MDSFFLLFHASPKSLEIRNRNILAGRGAKEERKNVFLLSQTSGRHYFSYLRFGITVKRNTRKRERDYRLIEGKS